VRAYWFEIHNRNAGRTPQVAGYGHYDDELRKVDGEWLFAFRRINTEAIESRAAAMENPGWLDVGR